MYKFRSIIETALAGAITTAGKGVAAGGDNPSELPWVHKSMGTLKVLNPCVICRVTRMEEAVEQSNVFKASCEIEVHGSADLDEADATFDPVAEHSSNCEDIFDVFQDSGIVSTLSSSGFGVMDRILNKGFDFSHSDREFVDTFRFDFICAITS